MSKKPAPKQDRFWLEIDYKAFYYDPDFQGMDNKQKRAVLLLLTKHAKQMAAFSASERARRMATARTTLLKVFPDEKPLPDLKSLMNQIPDRPVYPPPSAFPQRREYVGLGGGHWIKTVSGNGKIITLEDGSVWEISTLDQVDTALWLPVTDITVIRNASAFFPYKLVNKDDGETAEAKLLSQR